MPDPKFSETQLDAINGGVDIQHLGNGTSEIADQAGYLCYDDGAFIIHTVPTDQVDTWLENKMEQSPFWNKGK